MCTRLYPGLSPEFALAVGGEARPGAVTREHVATMAAALGMQPRFVLRQPAELAERLPAAVEKAVDAVGAGAAARRGEHAARLQAFVKTTTE